MLSIMHTCMFQPMLRTMRCCLVVCLCVWTMAFNETQKANLGPLHSAILCLLVVHRMFQACHVVLCRLVCVGCRQTLAGVSSIFSLGDTRKWSATGFWGNVCLAHKTITYIVTNLVLRFQNDTQCMCVWRLQTLTVIYCAC